ncbi:MAG: Uncharacterised protein [Cryomorphaceae bacterium]|nr:MAG: Uncharacterised protein [Cryomorphaceae bacterium]
MNGKVTEVMKKHLLFVGLSYALLTACSTPVSLTDNYFEDENYYNPTLPSPYFAGATTPSASDDPQQMDYDALWGDDNDFSQNAPVVRPQGGNTHFSWGFSPGMSAISGSSFWRWRLMQQNYMYGTTPYGFQPFQGGGQWHNNMWQDPWSPQWNTFGYSSGWGSNGWYDPWNPYGNGWGNNGWNNPWNSYSYGNGLNNNAWTNNGSNGTIRSGTNYGGARPSKYNTSRGNSASTGKTSDTPDRPKQPTGWSGILTPVKQRVNYNIDQTTTKQSVKRLREREVRRVSPASSQPTSNTTKGTSKVQQPRRQNRPQYNSYDRVTPQRGSTFQPRTTPDRSATPQRSTSPQSSSSPRRSSSNSSNSSGRRR